MRGRDRDAISRREFVASAVGLFGGGAALIALAGCPPPPPPPPVPGPGTGSGTKKLAPMSFDSTTVSISMGKGAEPIPVTVSGRIEADPSGAMKGDVKVAFPNGKTAVLAFEGMQATVTSGNVRVGIKPGMGAAILINGEPRTLGTSDVNFAQPLGSMGDLELALLGLVGVAMTPSFSQNARDIRAGLIVLAAGGFWCKAAVVACAMALAALGVAGCTALVAGCVVTVEIPILGEVTCATAEELCAAIAAGVGKGIEYLIEHLWGKDA